ncbi:DeoR/GlpR family DNA-binding transcription regulator [Nesterenkonia alba]|uniref:DeoR/GlpR family DNA-binding transcription regulator n=1 Tax=Nesterenkonia alba TaxID=515814 RepID=UPI0003B6C5A9|nr:DeoR/GlpR family DNA-binding transcription regulator [Nesterenkonia alba]
MATSSSLGAESRRATLLEILQAQGRISIAEAADNLDVSPMTLRRDLADLEAAGRLRRVRGGAVAPPQPRSFAERSARRAAAKRTIAQKALQLVPAEGMCAVDASSTAGVLLAGLSEAADLTVVTNSAENFEAAAGKPGITPVLIGGHRQATTRSFVGPLAELVASSVHCSRFFTSAAALDATWGSSESTPEEASLKRTVVEHSDSTVLLADSSKLETRAAARGIALEDVDLLVTELDPSDSALDPYRELIDLV